MGRGGLSGKPLLPDTLRIVSDVRKEVGETMTVNACGGISCADDVVKALESGADTVQIYTALVYEGPGLARKINRDLTRLLRQRAPPLHQPPKTLTPSLPSYLFPLAHPLVIPAKAGIPVLSLSPSPFPHSHVLSLPQPTRKALPCPSSKPQSEPSNAP